MKKQDKAPAISMCSEERTEQLHKCLTAPAPGNGTRYTQDELTAMLAAKCLTETITGGYRSTHITDDKQHIHADAPTAADALAELVMQLLGTRIISVEEVSFNYQQWQIRTQHSVTQ